MQQTTFAQFHGLSGSNCLIRSSWVLVEIRVLKAVTHAHSVPRVGKIDFRVSDFEPAKVIFQLHISHSTRCKKTDVKISMHSRDTALQSCEFHKT